MKKEKRIAAEELRRHGWAITDIAKHLNVAKSSVSLWVRDIPLTDKQKKTLALRNPVISGLSKDQREANGKAHSEKYRIKRRSFQEKGRQLVTNSPKLQQLAMLYWGEGAKSRNCCSISNADLSLLSFFKEHIEDVFTISPDDWTITLHVHKDQHMPMQELENFWLHGLNLNYSRLRKTMIDTRQRSINPHELRYPFGTAKLSLNRTEIVQTIYGAIQEIGGFEEPRWLE